MSMLQSFHEVRLPSDIALGAAGGPERRTEVVTLGSGSEQRNSRWANSRRKFNIGYGIKTLDDLHTILAFFEERRGRLFGFRFKDPLDWKSCSPGEIASFTDQIIGIGDGAQSRFQLIKRYGSQEFGYERKISKPVSGSLRIAINGTEVSPTDFVADRAAGEIVFDEAAIPAPGSTITCGYEFDIPVRFDTDEISVNLSNFKAGDIPSIPLVELLL